MISGLSTGRRLVAIESPYAGRIPEDCARNIAYLKLCILDSLSRGESPYASHGFFTYALDDADQSERNLGIACGFDWADLADTRVIYLDYGITPGMIRGINEAKDLGQDIEYRSITMEAVDETTTEQ